MKMFFRVKSEDERSVCVCVGGVYSEDDGSITPRASLKKEGIKGNLSEGEKGLKLFIDDTEPHSESFCANLV